MIQILKLNQKMLSILKNKSCLFPKTNTWVKKFVCTSIGITVAGSCCYYSYKYMQKKGPVQYFILNCFEHCIEIPCYFLFPIFNYSKTGTTLFVTFFDVLLATLYVILSYHTIKYIKHQYHCCSIMNRVSQHVIITSFLLVYFTITCQPLKSRLTNLLE
ncbi:MAG TPA: hypothetical protein VLG50_08415 [Candidatus Saccharimonadales bacterium]|nr:hypothetical protein [Candidatus Saccharimonadales bacterium]